jgi:hypothetical protein
MLKTKLKRQNAAIWLNAGGTVARKVLGVKIKDTAAEITVDGTAYTLEHYCRVIGSDLETVLSVTSDMKPKKSAATLDVNEVTDHE